MAQRRTPSTQYAKVSMAAAVSFENWGQSSTASVVFGFVRFEMSVSFSIARIPNPGPSLTL